MSNTTDTFNLRNIERFEWQAISAIEAACFPPHEACQPDDVKATIKAAPQMCLVAEHCETGEIAGFLNGIATAETAFRDEFFTDSTLHDHQGEHVMLLGLAVLPKYRGNGLARRLVEEYKVRAKNNERKTLTLTCLDDKVNMYKNMGFHDKGLAQSTWGNEVWHEMYYILQ
ncbi:GNAT family N-acetyltransferase [Allofustis seminis]|uniref:GNAT family N-acetyltransferase n=1 Tax=Allofustis seminis TaxID=166939 RepID=UPI0003628A84|nr:GNAT family N-acetyltransferase [Allofustis seminis]